MKKLRKYKRVYYLNRTLEDVVSNNFSNLSNDDKRELEFYLGSLVYPKEMACVKVAIYGPNGQVLKGTERSQKLKKVKHVHAALYNFSMDKCESFFDNRFLSMIFQNYAQEFEGRIASVPTIESNQDVYRSSLELINNRIRANNLTN
jgi:hypothetical protein